MLALPLLHILSTPLFAAALLAAALCVLIVLVLVLVLLVLTTLFIVRVVVLVRHDEPVQVGAFVTAIGAPCVVLVIALSPR